MLKFLCFLLFASNSWGLTLQEFIQLAEKNDPQYEKIISNKEKVKFLVDQGLPSRKTTLAVEQEFGLDTEEDEDTSVLSASVSKDFIETGTEVSLSHSKSVRPDREENVTEFRVEQALYKNIFGRDIRLKKKALEKEEEIVRLQVLENYESYLISIVESYLNFKSAWLDLKASESAYKEAESLKKYVSDKFKSRVASRTDLDRSELQVLVLQEGLLQKRKDYQERLSQVQRVIGAWKTFDQDKESEARVFPFINVVDAIDSKSLKDLRTVRVNRLRQEINKSDLTLAGREDSPTFNFIGGYTSDQSERFSEQVNRNEFIVGFNFEMPLGDSVAKANKRSAHLNLLQSEIDQKVILAELQSEIESLKKQIVELKERAEIGKKKVQVLSRIIKAEDERYRIGRINLDDLLDLRKDFLQYQFQYQSYVLDYNKALLKVMALGDQLLKNKSLL